MKKKLITMFLFLLLQLLLVNSFSPKQSSPKPDAEITVMGFVYCDVCSNNTFSRQSYFMSGNSQNIAHKRRSISKTLFLSSNIFLTQEWK